MEGSVARLAIAEEQNPPRCRHPHEAHSTPLLISKLGIAAILNHGEMAGSFILIVVQSGTGMLVKERR